MSALTISVFGGSSYNNMKYLTDVNFWEQNIKKNQNRLFITFEFWGKSQVWCGFASSLHVELGTLTKCHCGIFKELPNIKGEVVVAGGVLEEEDLPVVSFRPERELWDRWSTPLMFLSFSSVHVALKQGTLYTDWKLFTGRPVI